MELKDQTKQNKQLEGDRDETRRRNFQNIIITVLRERLEDNL